MSAIRKFYKKLIKNIHEVSGEHLLVLFGLFWPSLYALYHFLFTIEDPIELFTEPYNWLYFQGFLIAILIILPILCVGILFVISPVLRIFMKEKAVPVTSWSENNGTKPCGRLKVNVERQSGQIEWNVDCRKLDWGLGGDNPIRNYMIKEIKPK